jgi:nitrogen regulatory protein PII
MYAILFILDDPEKLDAVLDAWYAVGISGATIMESTGYQRRRAMRHAIPIRYAFPGDSARARGHQSIYVIVPDEEAVNACLLAAEMIVGDLDQPHTGVFTAWPLAVAKGVPAALRKVER